MTITKKHVFVIIKIIFIICALTFVFKKLDTEQIFEYIKSTDPKMLVFAYISLFFGQIASAFRMQYYFKTENVHLNNKFSIGLYFTGMFFNTILPGGVGGDGYKVYLIGKLTKFSKLSALRLLISDRASGLFIVGILSLIMALISGASSLIPHGQTLTIVAMLLLAPLYFLSIKLILKEKPMTAVKAIPFSLGVQILTAISVLFILLGVGEDINNISAISGYIFLFLISSVLSIVPISIGGAGVRELAFMYGAKLMGLNPELGVAIAIIIFTVYLTCSLSGLFFWHKLNKLYENK